MLRRLTNSVFEIYFVLKLLLPLVVCIAFYRFRNHSSLNVTNPLPPPYPVKTPCFSFSSKFYSKILNPKWSREIILLLLSNTCGKSWNLRNLVTFGRNFWPIQNRLKMTQDHLSEKSTAQINDIGRKMFKNADFDSSCRGFWLIEDLLKKYWATYFRQVYAKFYQNCMMSK